MTEKSYPRLEDGLVIYGPEQEKPQRVEQTIDVKAAKRNPPKPPRKPRD